MVTYTKSYYYIKGLLNILNIKTINLYILYYNYYYYILYYFFLIDNEPTVYNSKSFNHGIMDAILKSKYMIKGRKDVPYLKIIKLLLEF